MILLSRGRAKIGFCAIKGLLGNHKIFILLVINVSMSIAGIPF